MSFNNLKLLKMKAKIIIPLLLMIMYCNAFSQTVDTLWYEGWEETNPYVDWHASSGTWEIGIPTSGPNGAHTGQKVAATVLAGNYNEPVDSRLIRHTSFTVPPASDNPRFRFYHWYSFSAGDWGTVQISTDNGSTWNTISPTYDNTGSAVWSYAFIDLSQYAGSSVQVAFYFHSQKVGYYGDVSSGWYVDDVLVLTGQLVFNNPEGFEAGIGDWSAEKGTWEVGIPASGPNGAHLSQKCAATSLSGNYAETVDSRLLMNTKYQVPPADQNPRLRFWHWYSFSAGDWGTVQISNDEGVTWTTISPTYDNTGSGAWSCPFIDLASYAGQDIQIAFYFHAQQVGYYGDVSTGWYIDDILFTTGMNSLIVPEGFENGIGNWSAERGTWEVGIPTSGPGSSYSGQNCAATVLNGNYAETVDSRLISPPFQVSYQNPALHFWHWYSFAAGDYGEVQIKFDTGDWHPISQQYANTSSGVWTNYYISLSQYAGMNAQLGFFFHAQQVGYYGDVSSGWYIDEIYADVIGGINEISIRNADKNIELKDNFPNPFSNSTTISFLLSQPEKVQLQIFDHLGQVISNLADSRFPEGKSTVSWDAKDLRGNHVPDGVYYYQLRSGTSSETKKMLLIR
jgi:bacillopeptidase F (M6 metalloprotease family)